MKYIYNCCKDIDGWQLVIVTATALCNCSTYFLSLFYTRADLLGQRCRGQHRDVARILGLRGLISAEV